MSTVERGELFGVPIDLLTMSQTVEIIREAVAARRSLQHVALNVAKLVMLQKDSVLRDDVLGCDIIGVDGAGILIAARLFGVPVPECVTGIDLMMELLAMCAREGFRPYFLGGTESVVSAAAEQAQRRWPSLSFAGIRNGYFKPEEEADIARGIKDSGADCLFVGISSPIKERFCRFHRDSMNVPFIMGVGGSFDVLAGKTHRAPRLMRRAGMEWLFRLVQEPSRMWRRYLTTNSAFGWMILRALMKGYRGHTWINTAVSDP